MVRRRASSGPATGGSPESLRRDLAALAVTLTVLVPMLAGCAGICEEQNESHPPSCNGDNVRLSDYLGPQDVIATEGDVSWSHIPVTIAGVFDSGDLAFVPAEERD